MTTTMTTTTRRSTSRRRRTTANVLGGTTRTSLNVLLRDRGIIIRKSKITICQILVHHAKNMLDSDTTAIFLQSTLEHEIKNTCASASAAAAAGSTDGCKILLEAGWVPSPSRLV
jgi:hypothetical protein